ncbi:hypothetical protein KVT40_008520 [Elsinoe batatas]|uniref:Integral membrane protein n=1 Tax=Elsinoe batatas TaxID=2601811 RepID=A0A8K0KVK0_9PEZI|nr:hypothetical protein KVT40_008520 [Elsinoe batatas]
MGYQRRRNGVLAVATSFLLFANKSLAQQLLDFGTNALPACAQACQYLSQAQAACVPPAAPATGQETYLACFCQSAYLVNLRSDATQLCGNVCQGSDLPLISQWYTNTCATGANQPAVQQPTTTAATTTTAGPTTGPTTASTTTRAGSTATSASQSGTSSSSQQNQSWWAGHWKWVLMIILIVVILSLLTIAGLWWRRRHRRKRDMMSGRFNDGITTRATTHPPQPMTTTTSTGLVAFPYPGSAMGRGPHESGSNSRLASSANLPTVRESNVEAVRLAGVVAASGEDVRRTRGATGTAGPAGDTSKGKGRARISEDEVRR